MAVVVSPTLPFAPSSLDLTNPTRWTTLFPLLRPSLKPVRTSKGQTILVDTAPVSPHRVLIAAVAELGNLSTTLLSSKHISAIVTSQSGAGVLTARDIVNAVAAAGHGNAAGFVVVRAGRERKVSQTGAELVEVDVKAGLEFDHVLQLLGAASESTRSSVHHIAELLKLFVKTASTSHSTFHTEKAEANPAILHVSGHAGFEKARHAVERDLKHVLESQTTDQGPVTYSAHYSDVNGLSRLENYILGLEIAKYFESQNLPYALSTSTILQHDDTARGFAISICPVPQHILKPQQTHTNEPPAPKAAPTSTSATTPSKATSQPTTSTLTFSDADVRKRITAACDAVIAAEATITHYDEIVGDGDCGYTLRDGAKQVLASIASLDLAQLPTALSSLVQDLEVNMGGTSGALYCIFLTALASTLAAAAAAPSSSAVVPEALQGALAQLLLYTRARLGDRTLLDCLIPYVDALVRTGGDAEVALVEARKGVEGTKELEAKLGRSTYLDESATRGVPDPGAYGLLVLLEGFSA